MLYPTHLFRRGDIFYYRAKVPIDLKHQLKRREIWISLKTSDRLMAELGSVAVSINDNLCHARFPPKPDQQHLEQGPQTPSLPT